MIEVMHPGLPQRWPAGAGDPQVISAANTAEGVVTLDLDVPADCPWLEGHFPGQPVLPGVVQLRWALQLATLIWPDLRTVAAVSNLKFQNPVLPPAQLRLLLQRHPQAARIDFSYHQGEQRCALGRAGYA